MNIKAGNQIRASDVGWRIISFQNVRNRTLQIRKFIETRKSLELVRTYQRSPAWAKILIGYFGIFHDRVPGLRPHFRKLKKFRKGKIYVFRPTRGSGLSRYQVMVKSPGVLLRRTRYLVPHARQLRIPILLINWSPLCLSFACCLFYLYHSSLVIGMLICIVGLKYYGLGTQTLALGWPLAKVGTWVGV